jgi:hypothetical protein
MTEQDVAQIVLQEYADIEGWMTIGPSCWRACRSAGWSP